MPKRTKKVLSENSPAEEFLLDVFYRAAAAYPVISEEDAVELLRKAWRRHAADTAPGSIELEEAVGRTVERVEHGTTEGPYGDEPKITLHFTDGTRTGFVLPKDD